MEEAQPQLGHRSVLLPSSDSQDDGDLGWMNSNSEGSKWHGGREGMAEPLRLGLRHGAET